MRATTRCVDDQRVLDGKNAFGAAARVASSCMGVAGRKVTPAISTRLMATMDTRRKERDKGAEPPCSKACMAPLFILPAPAAHKMPRSPEEGCG